MFTVVSKIAKPKAQSEDRELQSKTPDNGTVRLQQIGIEPSQVNKTFNLRRKTYNLLLCGIKDENVNINVCLGEYCSS